MTAPTTHKEFGRFYRRDVAKIFFNAGLSYERRKVASMIGCREKLLIPFCGDSSNTLRRG